MAIGIGERAQVVLTAGFLETYQSEPRVEALFENGVDRVENEAGEKDLVAALIDLFVPGADAVSWKP